MIKKKGARLFTGCQKMHARNVRFLGTPRTFKTDACDEKRNHKHNDGCLPTAGCTGVSEAYDLAAASGRWRVGGGRR